MNEHLYCLCDSDACDGINPWFAQFARMDPGQAALPQKHPAR